MGSRFIYKLILALLFFCLFLETVMKNTFDSSEFNILLVL